MTLPERVRRAAAAVASQATLVRIDPDALDRLAAGLDPTPPEPFPEERWTAASRTGRWACWRGTR